MQILSGPRAIKGVKQKDSGKHGDRLTTILLLAAIPDLIRQRSGEINFEENNAAIVGRDNPARRCGADFANGAPGPSRPTDVTLIPLPQHSYPIDKVGISEV